jgi:hypothetical protein
MQISVGRGEVPIFIEQKFQLLEVTCFIKPVAYGHFPGLIMFQGYLLIQDSVVGQDHAHGIIDRRILMIDHAYNYRAIIACLDLGWVIVGFSSWA